MAYENIKTSTEDDIFYLTIDRADKMNALNRDTIDEIKTAIGAAEGDDKVKSVILTGDGEKAFAAGADIAEFKDYNRNEGRNMSENGHQAFNAIENCPKPVIAAINGFALGGGCELAMACHLRVAAENARFGQPEVGLGIIPGYGGTQRLIQLVGKGKAMELLMIGAMIDASEAQQLGLVNHVTTQAGLMEKCVAISQKITAQAPLAIEKIITSTNACFDNEQDGFETEIEQFAACFETEDFKEGTGAFLEKRKPSFKGK